MWNTINKLTSKKSKTTTISKINISNENVTDDPNEISHTFNTYFNTIGENLASELPGTTETPESYVTPSNSTFQIQNVSEVDVFHSLTTLKISKSCGHDKIPPKLLKDSAIVIAPFRAVGRGGIGGVQHPPKIGRFRIFGKLDVRLAVYSEIKKYVYIPHMNEKMAAFNTLFNFTSAIVWW